jgi:hypothetical protein
MSPFSLKERFGGRYCIRLDESWTVEVAENKRGHAGWYQQVPTRCGGFIALYRSQPVILQFFTPKQRIVCRRLFEQFKNTPGVRLDDLHDGFETVLYFPLELFEQVAEAVGARKKRQGRPLTEAQRTAFAEGRGKGLAALQQRRTSLLSDPSCVQE